MGEDERGVSDAQLEALDLVLEATHHAEERSVRPKLLERAIPPDDTTRHSAGAAPLDAFAPDDHDAHLDELIQSGRVVVKVEVDVEELIEWCRSQGRPIDGEARTDFVLEKLQEL